MKGKLSIMDFALATGDWDFCKNIVEISQKSTTQLIDEEVGEILPKINAMTDEQLTASLTTMIYAINHSERYTEEYLKNQFKAMKLRKRELLKQEMIDEFKKGKETIGE